MTSEELNTALYQKMFAEQDDFRKGLLTAKSLQAEYAALLTEKKAAYTDYRKARDEMKELLIVKANVDHLLGPDRREAEKEKEYGQR